MANFYWLASYPKSGNTWMRILLSNYLQDSDKPADINDLRGAPIATARVWFDEWAGIEASALDDTVIERLRPGVYRCMARSEQDTIYMKVHDAWGRTDRGEGLFPADATAGVIYIIRNPLDMAASCANHWGISIEKSVERLCNPEYAISRSLGGLSDQLRQFLGSWSSHVVSWVDNSCLPVHLVRYEDLRSDTHFYFGEVLRFCGLSLDMKRIKCAVEFSDFSELQRQEKNNNFCERPSNALGQFFRRGQSGAWREELSSDQVQRLIDVHGETMRRFGYLNENYQPV